MENPNDETAMEWLENTEGAAIAREGMSGVGYPRSVEVDLDIRVSLAVPNDLPDEEIKLGALYKLIQGEFEAGGVEIRDVPERAEFAENSTDPEDRP